MILLSHFIHFNRIYHSNSHHSGIYLNGSSAFIILLSIVYIFYLALQCMDRSIGYITRKQFIIYLLLPFSRWIIGFIKLFKKD